MSMTVDPAYKSGDLCRVTCDAARVQVEHRSDHGHVSLDGSYLVTVPMMQTELITVMNPARVWVESIAPDARASGITLIVARSLTRSTGEPVLYFPPDPAL